MTRPGADRSAATAIAGLVPILVAAALVGVRGELRPDTTVLILALTVAGGAAAGGTAPGLAAALSAAAGFDFFHTQPYRSLKMTSSRDILATVLLLALSLAVGGLRVLADRRSSEAEVGRFTNARLFRVLHVASTSVPDDVELAVRAELLNVLRLEECNFTPPGEPSTLPVLAPDGHLDVAVLRERDDGYELPRRGVRLAVEAHGRLSGWLDAIPLPDVGVSLATPGSSDRAGRFLGLALATPRTAPA